jgi:hypothetical protein
MLQKCRYPYCRKIGCYSGCKWGIGDNSPTNFVGIGGWQYILYWLLTYLPFEAWRPESKE